MADEDTFTKDFGITKPESVSLDDYHRMLDRVDGHLMGRGPLSERPTDMSSDALWYVTESHDPDIVAPDTLTRYNADAGEWANERTTAGIREIIGDIVNRDAPITNLEGSTWYATEMPDMDALENGDMVVIL